MKISNNPIYTNHIDYKKMQNENPTETEDIKNLTDNLTISDEGKNWIEENKTENKAENLSTSENTIILKKEDFKHLFTPVENPTPRLLFNNPKGVKDSFNKYSLDEQLGSLRDVMLSSKKFILDFYKTHGTTEEMDNFNKFCNMFSASA